MGILTDTVLGSLIIYLNYCLNDATFKTPIPNKYSAGSIGFMESSGSVVGLTEIGDLICEQTLAQS